MMQKLFYISFLFVLITACRNNDNELHQLLTHETDIQQVEYVVVATDTDCINCAFGIAKIIEKQPEVKGLYYSKYPKDALIRLNKIFPNIQWKQTHGNELLHYLRKQKEEGPYLIKITGHQAYIIDQIQ